MEEQTITEVTTPTETQTTALVKIAPSSDLEIIAPLPKHIRTEVGTSSIVKRWEFEVVDFSILPDQYKLPDMVKIRKVITAGATIPGIKSWKVWL